MGTVRLTVTVGGGGGRAGDQGKQMGTVILTVTVGGGGGGSKGVKCGQLD